MIKNLRREEEAASDMDISDKKKDKKCSQITKRG